MQNKLTKDQRYYRKKKREARTDFTKITREDSKEVRRVSRRATTLRVSQEAAERFKQMAELYDVTQWQMATRIINFGLKPIVPSYAKYRKEEGGYEWREELLNPVDRLVRYKGDIGEVQLNLEITITMWKKLRCHSTLTKQSMSRIFQRQCLDYKPLSPERLQKQRERYLADKARDDAYNRLACIDAPEMRQGAAGRQAKAYLNQLLATHKDQLRLKVINKDRYGRTVAEVITPHINVNLAMVRMGNAFVYRDYLSGCDGAEYVHEEYEARSNRYGVWNTNIQYPWDFRRNKR